MLSIPVRTEYGKDMWRHRNKRDRAWRVAETVEQRSKRNWREKDHSMCAAQTASERQATLRKVPVNMKEKQDCSWWAPTTVKGWKTAAVCERKDLLNGRWSRTICLRNLKPWLQPRFSHTMLSVQNFILKCSLETYTECINKRPLFDRNPPH